MLERRREKRFEEENRVIIEFVPDSEDSGNKKRTFALIQNMSIGGARILIDKFFPVDTVFRMTLTLSKSKQIVKLDGKVKWVRSHCDEDFFEIGVEFMHKISRTVLALIRHLYGKENGIPSILHF